MQKTDNIFPVLESQIFKVYPFLIEKTDIASILLLRDSKEMTPNWMLKNGSTYKSTNEQSKIKHVMYILKDSNWYIDWHNWLSK